MANIQIWQPRYKDNTALVARYKVGAVNHISFTKAKHLAGRVFVMDGDLIRQYPLETNGTIACYAVPMEVLEKHEQL